jgi:hypothetical protein
VVCHKKAQEATGGCREAHGYKKELPGASGDCDVMGVARISGWPWVVAGAVGPLIIMTSVSFICN